MNIDKKNIYVFVTAVALICLFVLINWKGQATKQTEVEQIPDPPLFDGCEWQKHEFSRITLWEQACDNNTLIRLHENEDGSQITSDKNTLGYAFKIEVLNKETDQAPADVVEIWYEELTSEQKELCSIQNPEEEVTYFPDRKPNYHERPNPTEHKTRYTIDVKPEVVQGIFDEYGGNPGGGKGRDYMCGEVVGATWGAYPPYFEFDDRSPEKYILVGSYAFEAPPIDLNSIRF